MKNETGRGNYAAPLIEITEIAVEGGIALTDNLRKPDSYEIQEWS